MYAVSYTRGHHDSRQGGRNVNIHEFKTRRQGSTPSQWSASQQRFLDLCDTLDYAVYPAYGRPEDLLATVDETILRRLLTLNLERTGAL